MSARWIMPTLFAIFTFTPLDRINGRLFQHGLDVMKRAAISAAPKRSNTRIGNIRHLLQVGIDNQVDRSYINRLVYVIEPPKQKSSCKICDAASKD